MAVAATMPGVAAGDLNWRIGRQVLGAGVPRNVFLQPTSGVVVAFEFPASSGPPWWNVSCQAPGPSGTGTIIGAQPNAAGTDTVATLPFQNNCKVVKNGVEVMTCRPTLSASGLNMWASRLEELTPGQKRDVFSSFAIEVTLAGAGCPYVGAKTLSGTLTAECRGGVSCTKIFFSTVPASNNLTSGTEIINATFQAEYELLLDNTISMNLNSGFPDWDIAGTLLVSASKAKYRAVGESAKISSAGLAVSCGDVSGAGTLTGGAPGTAESTLDFFDCSVPAESGCTVEEPVEVANVKSTLDILSEVKKEYGEKFEEFAGPVKLSGAECKSAGEYKLKGNLVGLGSTTTENLVFTEPAQEGSSLKLAEKAATLTGTVKEMAIESPDESPEARQEAPLFVSSAKQKFTGKSGTNVFANTSESITCSADTSAGEITGANTIGKTVVVYTGCKAKKGAESCTVKSVGAKEGEIVTKTLKGALGEVAESEAADEIGLMFEPETAKKILTVTSAKCISEAALEGSVAGEVSPLETIAKTSKVTLAATSSKQGIQTITVAGASAKKLKLELAGAGATAEGTDELEFEKAVEVN